MKKYYRFARLKTTKSNLISLFFNANESPLSKAKAIFIGVFIGLMPILGLHLVSAILSAQYFRVSKALAVLASYITITPLFPVVIYFSLKIGAFMIGHNGELPALNDISIGTIGTYLWLYLLGCIPIGIITAGIFSTITYYVAIKYNQIQRKMRPIVAQ